MITSDFITLERTIRHRQAVAQSDHEHIRGCLLEAARRFADLADIIEKDRNYDPVSFMRASAARFKLEAETN